MRDFVGERDSIKQKYITKVAIFGEFILHQAFKQEKIKNLVSEMEGMSAEYDKLSEIILAIGPDYNPNPDVKFIPENVDVQSAPVETQVINPEDIDSDKELIMRIETMISKYNEKWDSMGSYGGLNWRSGLNKQLIAMILEEINDN
jgi:hypothetical protein